MLASAQPDFLFFCQRELYRSKNSSLMGSITEGLVI